MTAARTLLPTHPMLPETSWPELAEFWRASSRCELRFPRCEACSRFQWYPAPMCPRCQSERFRWEQVATRGTVYSYTLLRRPFLPGLQDRLPIPIVLVEVDAAPGVRLVTNLVGEGAGLEIDRPVDIVFLEVSPGVTLPFATLAAPATGGSSVH